MPTFNSLTRGRCLRGLAVLSIISVFAAFSASASTAKAEAPRSSEPQLNRTIDPNFDPDTWKPTAEFPLPAMESPITFKVKDDASYWFDHENKDVEKVTHSRSLGAGVGPTTVKMLINEPNVEEAHTVTFVTWPVGAKNMPFDSGGKTGEVSIVLENPGLYAWQCVIHPYMLGAVVIDDPSTPGADFGKQLQWIDGEPIPTSADEVLKVVHSFFIITEPSNWQIYAADKETKWDPQYPQAPIMTYNEDGSPHLINNLHETLTKMHDEPKMLKPPKAPAEPGVGTIYYGSQWEQSAGKTKPGSITVFDAENWQMTNKWFGPSVNLNNPHNFWSDLQGEFLYSTNWYANNMTTLDRKTGAVLRELVIGPSPSHIVTRSTNDNLVIPNNGGGRVTEVSRGGTEVVATYMTQARGEEAGLPPRSLGDREREVRRDSQLPRNQGLDHRHECPVDGQARDRPPPGGGVDRQRLEAGLCRQPVQPHRDVRLDRGAGLPDAGRKDRAHLQHRPPPELRQDQRQIDRPVRLGTDPVAGEPRRQRHVHGGHRHRQRGDHRPEDQQVRQDVALRPRLPRRQLGGEEGRRLLRLHHDEVHEQDDGHQCRPEQ